MFCIYTFISVHLVYSKPSLLPEFLKQPLSGGLYPWFPGKTDGLFFFTVVPTASDMMLGAEQTLGNAELN